MGGGAGWRWVAMGEMGADLSRVEEVKRSGTGGVVGIGDDSVRMRLLLGTKELWRWRLGWRVRWREAKGIESDEVEARAVARRRKNRVGLGRCWEVEMGGEIGGRWRSMADREVRDGGAGLLRLLPPSLIPLHVPREKKEKEKEKKEKSAVERKQKKKEIEKKSKGIRF